MNLRAFTFLLFFSFVPSIHSEVLCLEGGTVSLADSHTQLFRQINSELEPNVTCHSPRMISIRNENDPQMDDSRLTRMSADSYMSFRSPPYGELQFHPDSRTAFWVNPAEGIREEIVLHDNHPGVNIARYAEAPERGTRFRQLPSPMAKTYLAFMYRGFSNINSDFENCQFADPGERDFRVALTENEINKCTDLIAKVKELYECNYDNCAELYENEFGYLNQRTEDGSMPDIPQMNAREMYVANSGLSKRTETIGKLFVADYAITATGYATLGYLATRGVPVLRLTALWSLLGNGVSAAWPFAFDFENCRPEDEGGNLDDCRALNPSRTTPRFQEKLAEIILNPETFNGMARDDDGGLARVACLNMEYLYINEAARFKNLPREVTCDKHTVTIGDLNYLHANDGHLIRRRSGHDTLHYYPDTGALYEENHSVGTVRDLTQYFDSTNGMNVVSEAQRDHRDLTLIAPRIRSALEGEECQPLAAVEGDFRPPSQ